MKELYCKLITKGLKKTIWLHNSHHTQNTGKKKKKNDNLKKT